MLEGDMEDLFLEAKKARDDGWPDSEWVFNRQGNAGQDIRGSWRIACIAAGVPELNFHDLRRTAGRNMRRTVVPQVNTNEDQRTQDGFDGKTLQYS
jgi:integrase